MLNHLGYVFEGTGDNLFIVKFVEIREEEGVKIYYEG
jgi:hypothetical protein